MENKTTNSSVYPDSHRSTDDHSSPTHTSHQKDHTQHENNSMQTGAHEGAYKKLFWMILISFVAMFILMYAMVDRLENVIINVNQFYMAGLMAAPMLIIELLLMQKMYPNKKLNLMLMAGGAMAMLLFWLGIRQQTAVGDVQFLKSMIPHHAGAILMVEESELQDPEVKKLGEEIIKAQEKEIALMKAKIKELENR